MYMSINEKPKPHHEIVKEIRLIRSRIEELNSEVRKVTKLSSHYLVDARLMLGYALKEFHAHDPYTADRNSREVGKKVYQAPVDQPLEKPIKLAHKEGTVEFVDELVKHIEEWIASLQNFYMDVASTDYNYNWVYRCLESAYTYLRLAQGHLGIRQFEFAKKHGYEIRSRTSDTVSLKVQKPNGGGFRSKGSV